MKIASSARRHGVSDEAIRHAVTNAIRMVDTDDTVLIIGPDTSGRLLEVVGRPDEVGEFIVFHAMRIRPVYAKRYFP